MVLRRSYGGLTVVLWWFYSIVVGSWRICGELIALWWTYGIVVDLRHGVVVDLRRCGGLTALRRAYGIAVGLRHCGGLYRSNGGSMPEINN